MRRASHKLRLALSALPWLLLSAACDKPEKRHDAVNEVRWTETPKPASGPEFDDPDFRLTVKTPTVCKKDGPMAPAPHTERLSVPIELEAKSKRAVPVGALLFTLEDPEGHEFRPTLAGCAPSLLQITITEAEEVSGEVAFDVPRGTRNFELRYEPFLIGREKVTARVKVPTSRE